MKKRNERNDERKELTLRLIREYKGENTTKEEKKQIMSKLVELNQELIGYAAKSIDSKMLANFEREDVLQHLTVLFIESVDKFNENKKVSFSTYFMSNAKYEKMNLINHQNDLGVKTTSSSLLRANKEAVELYLEKNYTYEKIQKELDLSDQDMKKVRAVCETKTNFKRYNKTKNDENEENELDKLVDSKLQTEDEVIEKIQLKIIKKNLHKIFKEILTKEETYILLNRFGINRECKCFTLAELAESTFDKKVSCMAIRKRIATIRKKIMKSEYSLEILNILK